MQQTEVEKRRERILEVLRDKGGLTRMEIEVEMAGVASSTLLRDLAEMVEEGRIRQVGQGKGTGYVLVGAGVVERVSGVMNSPTTKVTASASPIADEEPLVEVKVTNPVAYLKRWWQKVIGNEGIKVKFSLEIKPLTAIGMVVILATLGLGITTLGAMLKYLPFYAQFQQFVTAPDNSRELALEGRLYKETGSERYFLFTANRNEAVGVRATKLDLDQFDDLHVVLTGKYNDQTNLLLVETVREVGEVKQPSESELVPKPEASAVPTMMPVVVETEVEAEASGAGEVEKEGS